jgi:thymidine kinase
MQKTGTLKVICGPMKCGKSLELIRIVEKYKISGKKVLIIKPVEDIRDGDKLISRFGKTLDENVHRVYNIQHINTLLGGLNKPDLLAIDEFHFFKEDFVWAIYQWLFWGIDVIVSGLDINHRGQPFRGTADILAIADEVLKLKSICFHTKEDNATMTRMISYTPDDYRPGDKEYEPVCRGVWFEKMLERNWNLWKNHNQEER